jgi:hypothetical protein
MGLRKPGPGGLEVSAPGLGVGPVPDSPLGRGCLAGLGIRAEDFPEGDFRRAQPRTQGGNSMPTAACWRACRHRRTRSGAPRPRWRSPGC